MSEFSPLFITNIKAQQFRNYKHLSCPISSNINLFLGDNGQGKTSILEAIHCCLRAKSFRPYVHQEFIQEGQKQSHIQLKIKEPEGSSLIQSHFVKKKFFG